jgi:hypothetical protein
MAKFSKKMGGKEVGDAKVYAEPHGEAYKQPPLVAKHSTPVTIGELREEKKDGIKMRGVGAATKGTMSRGPMA